MFTLEIMGKLSANEFRWRLTNDFALGVRICHVFVIGEHESYFAFGLSLKTNGINLCLLVKFSEVLVEELATHLLVLLKIGHRSLVVSSIFDFLGK